MCHRAGLYKQLAELKALVAEYREDPAKNAALKVTTVHVLSSCYWSPSLVPHIGGNCMCDVGHMDPDSQVPIVENLTASGLQEDCPFRAASTADSSSPAYLTAETVDAVDTEAFAEYAGRLNTYLQVCATPPCCIMSSTCKSAVGCVKACVFPTRYPKLPGSLVSQPVVLTLRTSNKEIEQSEHHGWKRGCFLATITHSPTGVSLAWLLKRHASWQ